MLSLIPRSSARISTRALTQVRTYATPPPPKSKEQSEAMDSVGEGLKSAGKALQSDGSIGKNFNPDGAIGGTAQQGEFGGPFDKDGVIGKQFTDTGAIGGTGQKVAEATEEQGKDVQRPS